MIRKVRLVVLTFIILHLLPFLLSKPYLSQLSAFNFAGRRWDIDLLLMAIPFQLIFEISVLTLLFRLTWGDPERTSTASNAWSLKPLYCFVLIVALLLELSFFLSWACFNITGAFLSFSNLWIFRFLIDFRELGRLTELSQLPKLFGALGCIVIVLGLVVLLERYSRRISLRGVIQSCLYPLFIFSMLVGVAVLRSPYHGRESFLLIARESISPQYTLLFSLIDLVMGLKQPGFDYSSLPRATNLEQFVAENPHPQKRPNILLVIIEALRADVVDSRVNEESVMPFLFGLADRGVSFKRAYSQAPETDYSQGTILSGQYPLRSWTRDLHANLKYPHTLIYDLLKAYGYKTAYLTNEWETTKKLTQTEALDLYFDPSYGLTDQLKQLSPKAYEGMGSPITLPAVALDRVKLKILGDWFKVSSDYPLFAAVFLYASHFPYDLIPPIAPLFEYDYELKQAVSFYGYDLDLADKMRQRYFATLRYVDSMLKDLLAMLERENPGEENIVIVTGDHGELFGEHGLVTHAGHLCEEVLHVPLVFWNSKGFGEHAAENKLVGHIDISPSIVSFLELPAYNQHQGLTLFGREALAQNYLRKRLLYSSVQTFVSENAVFSDQWFYTSGSLNSPCAGLQPIDSENTDMNSNSSEVQVELRDKLKSFVDSQIGYYSSLDRGQGRWSVPPRH